MISSNTTQQHQPRSNDQNSPSSTSNVGHMPDPYEEAARKREQGSGATSR